MNKEENHYDFKRLGQLIAKSWGMSSSKTSEELIRDLSDEKITVCLLAAMVYEMEGLRQSINYIERPFVQRAQRVAAQERKQRELEIEPICKLIIKRTQEISDKKLANKVASILRYPVAQYAAWGNWDSIHLIKKIIKKPVKQWNADDLGRLRECGKTTVSRIKDYQKTL
jgi:hypothetical protein